MTVVADTELSPDTLKASALLVLEILAIRVSSAFVKTIEEILFTSSNSSVNSFYHHLIVERTVRVKEKHLITLTIIPEQALILIAPGTQLSISLKSELRQAKFMQ